VIGKKGVSEREKGRGQEAKTHRNDDLVLVILPALPAFVIPPACTTTAAMTTRRPVERVAHTLPVARAVDAREPTPVLRNRVREPLVRPTAAVVLLPVRGRCYVQVEGEERRRFGRDESATRKSRESTTKGGKGDAHHQYTRLQTRTKSMGGRHSGRRGLQPLFVAKEKVRRRKVREKRGGRLACTAPSGSHDRTTAIREGSDWDVCFHASPHDIHIPSLCKGERGGGGIGGKDQLTRKGKGERATHHRE
jgi:hypothetical protein